MSLEAQGEGVHRYYHAGVAMIRLLFKDRWRFGAFKNSSATQVSDYTITLHSMFTEITTMIPENALGEEKRKKE